MKTYREFNNFCTEQWARGFYEVEELFLSEESIQSLQVDAMRFDYSQPAVRPPNLCRTLINPINGKAVTLTPLREYAVSSRSARDTVYLDGKP